MVRADALVTAGQPRWLVLGALFRVARLLHAEPAMRTRWSWQAGGVSPADYENLPELVRLARRARRLWVDFSWELDRQELDALRRAIREWTTKTTGRYRAFDKAMLATIGVALGESAPPADPDAGVGRVECSGSDGDLRLTGATTFDVAFGYASAGSGTHLSEPLRAALADGFTQLGWDVRRLMEPRYRPATNALYGVAPSSGVQQDLPPVGDPLVVDAAFEGPFALMAGDVAVVFDQPVAVRAGVYLWTVETSLGYRPWYVGQTGRSFAQRTAEHVGGYLSGQYEPHTLASIIDGSFRLLPGGSPKRFPGSLPEFRGSLPDRLPQILDVIRATRIFMAPLEGGARVLDRVEGAIGRHCKTHHREYLVPGQRVPDAIPGDCPLVLRTSAATTVLGLPAELREPR